MISVTGKKWAEKKVNKNIVEKIKQDYNFTDIISKLIVSRNFNLLEINSINNKLAINNEFTKNVDFKNAADLLINSIKRNENICILGDYDVDGSASTSLLVRFFNYINQLHFYYIPDREKDGYGATKELFEKLVLKKPKLVIMVDCGSTSNDAIDYLNNNNIKSIIIDHHEINKPYPKSNIIINPKKNIGYIKYDYLCATALTYFFLDIVIKKINSSYNLSNYQIYVLLASVCDVMPLRKINRIFAQNVIDNFDVKKNIAFNTLFKLNNKSNKITINDLGFFIGPIINSGGRLGKSRYGTELLTSNDLQSVTNKSNHLIKLNNKRKELETKLLSEIDLVKIKNENKNIIIYYNPNINEGLIGIIAARLKEYFNKPSIVITRSKNFLKGSARSIYKYNIGHLIKVLKENEIIEKGGGHDMAAGFTMRKDKVNLLETFAINDFKKNFSQKNFITFDAEISPSAININFINEINKMEPFGNANERPTFLIKELKIIKTSVLVDKHISFILKPKIGTTIKAISFNSLNTEIGKYILSYKKNISVVAQIYENIWNNKKTLQLNIKDIII